MNGPSNVTLANTNSNTSELYLVTMNQGAEQMENLDAVQNQISPDQVYLGGPQFIEITSKVAPNVGQYDYAEPEMPMDESEPLSDNLSSEPASHAEYSEIEEKLDQMDAEIKGELRRLSMEKEVNMLVVEQVKQPPNQAATDKPSLKYKIVKSRPAAIVPPTEPVLPPRDSSGRFLPMKSTSRKENRQSISPNYPPTSPQNDNLSSSSHSNQSHEEAADEANQEEPNKHKEESMSLTDNEQQREEETLGRKRRRRQKNRYFLDFHCSDLTKGTRSKDDIDAYAVATGGGSSAMRSSNRRITVEPSKSSEPTPQQDEAALPLYQNQHCRSCNKKTPHDFETGCQACLYKKIVRNQKKKSSSQRSKSSRPQSQQNERQQADIEPTESLTGNNQAHQEEIDKKAEIQEEVENHKEVDIQKDVEIQKEARVQKEAKAQREAKIHKEVKTQKEVKAQREVKTQKEAKNQKEAEVQREVETEKCMEIDKDVETNEGLDLSYPDRWTPDEVAQFISQRGFPLEAEVFRSQAIDGISLLLMQRSDFTSGLRLKLGPAIKLFNQVTRLREDYLRRGIA